MLVPSVQVLVDVAPCLELPAFASRLPLAACRLLPASPACFRWQNVIVSCGSLFVCLFLAHFGLSACQLLAHKQVADRVLASHLKALTGACVQLCCANSTMAAVSLSLSFTFSISLSLCLSRSLYQLLCNTSDLLICPINASNSC